MRPWMAWTLYTQALSRCQRSLEKREFELNQRRNHTERYGKTFDLRPRKRQYNQRFVYILCHPLGPPLALCINAL